MTNAHGGRPNLADWRPDWDFGPLADYPVYTRANIGEVIPGVISPLNASLGARTLDAGFMLLGKMLGMWDPFLDQLPAGVATGEEPAYVGVFYGRAYLNLSLLTLGAALLPGTSAATLEEQYLGGVRNPGEPRPALTLRERRIGLLAVPRFVRALLRAPRLTREQDALVDRYLAREAAYDAHSLDDEALLRALARQRAVTQVVMGLHLFNSSGASAGLEQLSQAVRRWLPDAPAGFTETLVTGLPDVESAKPAYGLWKLSRMAVASPSLGRLFTETTPADLNAALQDAPGEEAAMFRAELAAFLKQYGYRALREAELSSPPWSEEPSFVFATIKSYMRLDEDADPVAAHERQAAARAAAERTALAELNPVQRQVFKRQLQLAQTYIALREQSKAQFVRALGPARRACQELGRRLVERGLAGERDDIYLLLIDELPSVCSGALDAAAVRALIARRRQQVSWCEAIELPEWFEGTPAAVWADQQPAQQAAPATGETVLRGIPVSPGRVRGRARVITELDDDATVEQGEILVAPFTDAAWTPLFFTAAGVVVDLGGPLSHGSTVAREYGLPAVVNVKDGTRRIRNGQEITVDGAAGEVILHA
jgi:rifampicin phosphotransferase